MRIWLVVFMLMSVAGFSKDREDTLWSRNSIRIDLFGKAFGGVGFVYERVLIKKHPGKRPNAFTSIEAGISYPYIPYEYVAPSVGINRNWSVGRKRRIILNAGISAVALISFKPTPKATRDFYKETNFYGGNFVSPIEPWLFGDFGIKLMLKRWFYKISFTPFIYHFSLTNKIYGYPWGGVSFGFKLKK